MYWKYVLRRLLQSVLTFVVIIFIYSALFNTVMETTLRSQINEQIQGEMMQFATSGLTAEELKQHFENRKERLYEQYHLNDSLPSRIFWRAIDTLTLNFGKASTIKSASGSSDVMEIITEKIPNTLLLFLTASVIDVIIGIALGLKKAQKPNGRMDRWTSIITMIVYGLPTWWLGMVFIMFFSYVIPIFPSGGIHSIPPPEGGLAYFLDTLYHLALPVLVLVIVGFWGRAYLIRNIVLGTLQEDFIMSARARGLSERRVLFGHTLRTAAPPIVTMALTSMLLSISGGLIYEGIFSWPGMGNLYWIAVQQNDIPVLMGNLALTTALYLMGLVILDLIYGFLDPRIKVGGKA
ncbi:MAG TPA: ABC transporter permease [Firmicutes bacterium]|nr:ABC transporter permease [Bacillota bacterium]